NTGNMTRPHGDHTATLLQSGKVLVAGGQSLSNGNLAVVATSELYDPATGTWSATGSLSGRRSSHAAVGLANGQVLVAGGTSGMIGGLGALASAEVYDPGSGSWSNTGAMSTARMFFTMTVTNAPAPKPLSSVAPASICITIVCAHGGGPVLVTGGWNPQT